MHGPRHYHAKSDRESQISYFTYMWNLTNDADELISKTETDSRKKNLWSPKRRGGKIGSLGLTYTHGSGWTPGVGDGQGGLACCGSWGRRVGHD